MFCREADNGDRMGKLLWERAKFKEQRAKSKESAVNSEFKEIREFSEVRESATDIYP